MLARAAAHSIRRQRSCRPCECLASKLIPTLASQLPRRLSSLPLEYKEVREEPEWSQREPELQQRCEFERKPQPQPQPNMKPQLPVQDAHPLHGTKGIVRELQEAARKRSHDGVLRAWTLVQQSPDKVTLSLSDYQDLMKAARLGLSSPDSLTRMTNASERKFVNGETCIAIWRHMREAAVEPNDMLIRNYMRALAFFGRGRETLDLLEELEDHPTFDADEEFLYGVVSALSTRLLSKQATKYYTWVKEKKMKGNRRMFYDYIWCLKMSDRADDACQALSDMLDSNIPPSERLLTGLLMECCTKGLTQRVEQLLQLFNDIGQPRDAKAMENLFRVASLSDAYAELYQVLGAWLSVWGIAPTTGILQQVAIGQMAKGDNKNAMAGLVGMLQQGHEVELPVLVKLAGMLSASNQRTDEAYFCLMHMHENGIEVPLQSLNLVLMACAMRGSVDRTFSTAESIERVFGCNRDALSYNAMLRSLQGMTERRGNEGERVELGLSLIHEMTSKAICPNGESIFRLLELVRQGGCIKALPTVLSLAEEEGIELTPNCLALIDRLKSMKR